MRNVSRCRCSARTADHAIARSGCAFGRAVQDLRQMLPGTDVTEEVQEALKGIPLPFAGEFEEVIMIEVAIEEMVGSD